MFICGLKTGKYLCRISTTKKQKYFVAYVLYFNTMQHLFQSKIKIRKPKVNATTIAKSM